MIQNHTQRVNEIREEEHIGDFDSLLKSKKGSTSSEVYDFFVRPYSGISGIFMMTSQAGWVCCLRRTSSVLSSFGTYRRANFCKKPWLATT